VVGTVGSVVSNQSRRGRRLDLNTDDFSGVMDVTDILAFKGRGKGVGRGERPCLVSERYDRSFSIFFNLESFDCRISFARVERLSTSSPCLRRISR